jgi:hypothetical protein
MDDYSVSDKFIMHETVCPVILDEEDFSDDEDNDSD